MTKKLKSVETLAIETIPQPLQLHTWLNYEWTEWDNFEHPTGVSETVPNEVLSPQQMLERFSQGLPLTQDPREPIYSEEELPDFEQMDLSEIYDWQQQNREDIEQMENEIKAADQAIMKQKYRDAIKAELTEELNKTTPPPTTGQNAPSVEEK